MKTWLIAGGSGMIGHHLTKVLTERGDKVRWLSRRAGQYGTITAFSWNPAKGTYDPAAFANVDYILNLAGAGIADRRWTESYKKEIIQSRLSSIATLRKALLQTGVRPEGILCASATGFYGDRKDEWLTEESDPGKSGFLASTTIQWEAASKTMQDLTNVWSMIRIGVVLSRDGGAWPKLSLPARFGISGFFGGGCQYLPWIHIDDLVSMILWIIDGKHAGIWNGVAPQPVTGKELADSMVAVQGWGFTVSIPTWGIRLIMGEMADTVLTSARVSANKTITAGFAFLYHSLRSALADLLNKS